MLFRSGTEVPTHALVTAKVSVASKSDGANATEEAIEEKMKELEAKMAPEAAAAATGVKQGRIVVNGPLPTDFSKVFADAVATATGCAATEIKIIETHAVASSPASFLQLKGATVEVVFEAPADVVDSVESQAADPESKLVNGASTTTSSRTTPPMRSRRPRPRPRQQRRWRSTRRCRTGSSNPLVARTLRRS